VKIRASGKAVTMHQPWLTTALMEWNALHTIMAIWGAAGIMCERVCSCYFWPEPESAEDELLYKYCMKLVQGEWKKNLW